MVFFQKNPTMADFRFLRTHFFLVHPVDTRYLCGEGEAVDEPEHGVGEERDHGLADPHHGEHLQPITSEECCHVTRARPLIGHLAAVARAHQLAQLGPDADLCRYGRYI